jgi:uncharacterized membrane protein
MSGPIIKVSHAIMDVIKGILDSFTQATCLVINFDKCTLVLMHANSDTITAVHDAHGCAAEAFPQNYFTLPLPCDKMKLAAFAPLIVKADTYLSG